MRGLPAEADIDRALALPRTLGGFATASASRSRIVGMDEPEPELPVVIVTPEQERDIETLKAGREPRPERVREGAAGADEHGRGRRSQVGWDRLRHGEAVALEYVLRARQRGRAEAQERVRAGRERARPLPPASPLDAVVGAFVVTPGGQVRTEE